MPGWCLANPIVPAALWILPLITDSVIFLLTLHRSREYWRNAGMAPYVPHPMTPIPPPITTGFVTEPSISLLEMVLYTFSSFAWQIC